MFYDLNVPWTSIDDPELQRTVAFLDELGYNVIALNYTLTGKIPNKVTCPIPRDPFPNHKNIRFLSRVTVVLDDHGQNYGLPALTNIFDIVALRPTSEKILMQACSSLECDLISLDASIRHPYHFKHKTLGMALARGLRFEISYAAALINDTNARRNVISNATQLAKVTKGKGLIASSEAKRAVGCRAPYDVINLATLWGLSQDKGRCAVADNPRSVVVQAEIRRRSFRGVIDVVDPGGAAGTALAAKKVDKKVDKKADKKTDKKMDKKADKKADKTSKEEESASKEDTPMTDAVTPLESAAAAPAKAPEKAQDKTQQPGTPKGKRKQDETDVMEEDTPGKTDENSSGGVEKKPKQNTRTKRPSKKQRVKDAKKAASAE